MDTSLGRVTGSRISRLPGGRATPWIAPALCAAATAAWTLGQLVGGRPAYAGDLAPGWLPLAAAALAAAAIVLRCDERLQAPRLGRALSWAALLLLLWTASGLPLDLLRVTSLLVPGLMPPGVDWPGLASRALALAALVVLARQVLARPDDPEAARDAGSSSPVRWYGYAAFVLALPYPVLKTWWALGGSFGLRWPGAEGLDGSFALWLPAVPWLLAAALSLLLASTPRWMPRRLLLTAGWSATVVVATIGPAAFWSLVGGMIAGDAEFGAMYGWVSFLFYGSWFLWAIAAGAATRAYQLRTAAPRTSAAA